MGVSSMTGFARVDGEMAGISWTWELKSVNGRSLDLRLRLPPGYDGLEAALRAEIAGRVRRGSISANLTVTRVAQPTIRINREMLARVVALVGELSAEVEAAPPRLDPLNRALLRPRRIRGVLSSAPGAKRCCTHPTEFLLV